MRIVPHNNAVLCKQLNSSLSEEQKNGLVFQKEDLPLYIVEAIGENVKKISLEVGDIIATDAQPTKMNIDSTMLFLIRDDHIAAKVEK